MSVQLRPYQTDISVEFEREAATLVDGEHVRRAGDDAEALQDRGLDRLAIAAVGGMEGEDARCASRAQVLEDSALNGGLWASAAARHDAPRCRHERLSGGPIG